MVDVNVRAPLMLVEEFLTDLHDVSDPEQKRKLIGERFIRVFEAEAAHRITSYNVCYTKLLRW